MSLDNMDLCVKERTGWISLRLEEFRDHLVLFSLKSEVIFVDRGFLVFGNFFSNLRSLYL